MQPSLENGFYLATNSRVGAYSVNTEPPSAEQLNNANIIRSFFIDKGWTINAICGMLGCMQGESTINPAFIQATNRYRLPNSADNLWDVPNSIMANFFMEHYADSRKAYGIGLVQWDGYTIYQNQDVQKMVAFAIANNIIWYDGWTQLYRLHFEQQSDETQNRTDFFKPVRYSGVVYTFTNYPYSTETPELLATAFTSGYERNAGGVGFRADNARWWYNYFTDPNAPAIIDPTDFYPPLPADPYEPPFDPDHPVTPSPDAPDFPSWFLMIPSILMKGGKQKIWRKM